MTDTKKELLCPACGKKMAKINTSAGVYIDICVDGCGGIWFDNRELEKFDEIHENAQEIQDCLKDKTFKPVNTEETRKCPVCGCNMVKHKASPNCDIDIDECYTCGGKFLDYKELDNIRSSKPTTSEQIDTVVDALYQNNGYTPYKAEKNSIRDFIKNVYNIYDFNK